MPTVAPDPAIAAEASRLAEAEAIEVVRWVDERFGSDAVLACSFQKEEAVLLHLLAEAGAEVKVFALDTGVLFPETYATWQTFEQRFGVEIEPWAGITLAEQEAEYGPELWASDPGKCCAIRKVEPLNRALAGRKAWITGIRRDQSPTRAEAPKAGWDDGFGIWKANPLADWDSQRVLDYIAANELPSNPLHDIGYESIGCTYCTMPGSGREGRWSGNDKTECGLHTGEQAPGEEATA